MPQDKVFVYVQAIPESIPSRTKSFADLKEATTSFRMSHSSKVALAMAKNPSTNNVIALGHSSILREALAFRADDVIALPLCDDPLVQAQSIKEQKISEDLQLSILFVGENLDGPFSGSSLCGALSALLDLNFEIDDLKNVEQRQLVKNGSVVLVRDDGTRAFNVNIRRLGIANSKEFPQSKVVGTNLLDRREPAKNPETISDGSPKEIASTISRRLRRFTV
jgi:hypothetical protein